MMFLERVMEKEVNCMIKKEFTYKESQPLAKRILSSTSKPDMSTLVISFR